MACAIPILDDTPQPLRRADEQDPIAPAPDKSYKTNKWRLALASRLRRGQTAVCNRLPKRYESRPISFICNRTPLRRVDDLVKPLLFTLLLLIAAAGISAQEAKAALGIGAEWNMNSRDNFAGGAAASFDYNLPRSFALGLSAAASSNFSGISVLEPAALLRWYFLGGGSGWFIQADAGAFLIFEDGDITPLFAGGLRGGYRLPLKSSFYIEPYGRIGYPFAFGVGAAVGIRFFGGKS